MFTVFGYNLNINLFEAFFHASSKVGNRSLELII